MANSETPSGEVVVGAGVPGAYPSISEAVEAAQSGTLIRLLPGTYEESIVVDKQLTIVGDGERDTVVIKATDGPAVTLLYAIGIVVRSVTLVGLDDEPALDLAADDATVEEVAIVGGDVGARISSGQATIRRSLISKAGAFGIMVTDGATAFVHDNEIMSNRGTGMYVSERRTKATISGNVFHDNVGGGIAVAEGGSGAIESNEIFENRGDGVSVTDSGGTSTLTKNDVHGNRGSGISITDRASPLVEANQIHNNRGDGIWISDKGTNPRISKNTIAENHGAGIHVYDGPSPHLIENEISANQGDGIDVSGKATTPEIRANKILSNDDSGVSVSGGASPSISDNEIAENQMYGMSFWGAGTSPTLLGNTLRGNREGEIDISDGADIQGAKDEEVSSERLEQEEARNDPQTTQERLAPIFRDIGSRLRSGETADTAEGWLKGYAAYLGVDPADVLRLIFSESLPPHSQDLSAHTRLRDGSWGWLAGIRELPDNELEGWSEYYALQTGTLPVGAEGLRQRMISAILIFEAGNTMEGPAVSPLRLPPEALAAFQSAGAVLATDADSGTLTMSRNGVDLARIERDPLALSWADPQLGILLRLVLEYSDNALLLQANRGFDTIGLRDALRSRLQMEPVLRQAEAARCQVEQSGGVRAKEYFVSHPALDEFARFTVFRGSSHVVDVAFPTPAIVVLLKSLIGLEDGLSDLDPGAASPPSPDLMREGRVSDRERVSRFLALLAAQTEQLVRLAEGIAEPPREPRPGHGMDPQRAQKTMDILHLMWQMGKAEGEAAPHYSAASESWAAGRYEDAATSYAAARNILIKVAGAQDVMRTEAVAWERAASAEVFEARIRELEKESTDQA